MTISVTQTELKNQRKKGVSWSRSRASVVNGCGIRLSALLLASVWVLNEVTNWMMKGNMYSSAKRTSSV